MKTKISLHFLFLLLVTISFTTKAQDSTAVRFVHLNRELSLLNSLNNIQYTGFISNDTLARGKKFLLYIEEYENGKKITLDTTDLECNTEIIPMEINGKTVNYRFDPCSRKTFSEEDETFTVALAGKLETDTFRLLIDYPSVRLIKKLKRYADYSLRIISCGENERATIPFNKLTPIFAYTPPFDTGKGLGSYCILGTEDVKNWFQKFGLKHYYVIHLIIR